MIPYGRHEIDNDDVNSVVEVLENKFLTQGDVVPEFEREVSSFCGAHHAIALNSATSALHLACRALEVKRGDIVWTSPISFVASANCAIYCGAKIDFVDINPNTNNIDPTLLKLKLIKAKKNNQLPKVVIPVHLCGLPCEMSTIWELSKEFNFQIIEDASHALGAEYNSTRIGNCKYSSITVFSFHPVKMITTGEGGMALTNSREIYERIKLLRSHGITKESKLMDKEKEGPWYYQQIELGYNYRMTDIQAALGISQLKKLEKFILNRSTLAERYIKNLKSSKFKTPLIPNNAKSSWHLFVVKISLNSFDEKRILFEYLIKNKIQVNLHYIPIYSHPFYKNFGFKKEDFPNSEKYYKEALTLPLFSNLSFLEQDKIITKLEKFSNK
ncbi:UDP-4-amino-4,6-dideoxy-N-acetyl-beta-L-altrosamine transaminase [Prochlorococcus marinus str. MU1404]|nr:UDP-4-amino-4,6-dideoxy-N-acetyl-beta-L-altrosamine transaminase [Prochlorococcus marinus XMU1404]MBW3073584.1 UDP-4-amino-4,6-dideoxy-N-acetyl-beta-L-altrosamine transaminase [Prochlorococcus marinus str. MU1404]